jgi:hypothetical protein
MPVLDDLIDVTFDADASQGELQAAVDSIHGEVVGGFRREPRVNTYVVRIKPDATGASLAAALRTLRSFPVVILAMPIDAEQGASRYRSETPPVLGGCVTLRIELASGSPGVSTVPSPFCGPILPIVRGRTEFDSSTRRLRIPVAIENTWSRGVSGPLELYAWNDSIIAADSVPNRAGQRFRITADAAGWRDDATIQNGARWSFDSLLNTRVGGAQLSAGSLTRPLVLELFVAAGAPPEFELRLRVRARHVNAGFYARTDSGDFWTRADTARFSDGIYKRVISISFRGGVSAGARQAAIDSVQGTQLRSRGDFEPDYFRIRTDGTRAGLDRAIALLKSLPQVRDADVYIDLRIVPNDVSPEMIRILTPPDSTAAPARRPPS